jgi:uncharacterized protein YbjT (DUF2867 family)
MASAVSNSAVVIGATGLFGRECVKLLVARPEFERVTAVARRALPDDLQSPRLRTVLIDFDRLEERSDVFRATHVFCALGTTIKQAGSRERFRQVDLGYPLRAADLTVAAGSRHLLLVSSVGASSASLERLGRPADIAPRSPSLPVPDGASRRRRAHLGQDRRKRSLAE